jgi:cytochrome c oxidase subunit II
MLNFPLFPDQASTMAGQVDGLYFFIIAITAFFAVLVSVLAFYFAFRYRKERNPVASPVHGSLILELSWTIVPLLLSIVIFVWGAWVYYRLYRTPKGAMEVYVIGKQWMWKVEHPSGVREINQLHIPINRDVKLIMTSQDVIHAVFIPAFRVKADVVPGAGRYSTLWFNATKPGTYHLFCAEYCGTHHSGMIGQVIAMEPAEYERWLSGGGSDGGGSMAGNGEKLFTQLGCISCHSGASGARGPNLNGVYGNPVQLANGQTIVADEAYIKESVLSPTAKVVAGFQPIMPSFQGQISEEGILQIIEFVKSKSQSAGGAAAATAVPAGATPASGPAVKTPAKGRTR